MFDNFGLGEFFFLALLALLFFGPERLPQIGAQIGKWIARLTQYSKSFMNEWRDEALAIHEAVEEVRGIRDEIAAARAEISSTLDTARGDLTEGIDAAKEAVTGARMDVTNRLALQQQEASADLERMAREERGEALPGEASPDGDGEDVAIARTQQILDDLRKSREEALLARAEAKTQGKEEASKEDVAETEPGVSEVGTPEEGMSAEDEWAHIRGLIEAGLSPTPRKTKNEASEESTGPAPDEVTEPETAEVETEDAGDGASVMARVAENAPEPPRETAFDRSQKILENLRKRRAGIPVEEPTDETTEPEAVGVETAKATDGASVLEQVAENVPEPPRETAFDRSQKILEDLKKRRAKPKTPAAEEATADSGMAAATQATSPEFQELAAQVVHLQGEIELLRRELKSLHDLSARSVADQDGSLTSDEVSVEEAA